MGQPQVVQQTAYAAYGGAEADALNNTGQLAAAVSISPITGKARKQLILALLEDPGVRLAARHAELLLRWRMMAIEPALHSVPALQPSAQPLQPHLLRAALAEDAVASTPVLLLSEQLLQLLSSPQPMPAEPNNSGQPAWERAMLQLDLQRLSTALCMPPSTGGVPSNSASPKPGMHSVGSENPLPSFLYEYESPTTSCSAAAKQAQAGGSLDAVTAPSPPPAPATTSPAPGSDSASLARSSTGMLAERPASDAALSSPPPPPPADPPRLHRISAPAAPASSAGSHPDATSGGLFSPSSAHPSAAAQMVPGVPEEVASCWGMPTDTLSDQHAGLARIGSLRQQPHPARLSKQQSGPCMLAPERRPSSGLGASWVSTSPASHGYTRQQSSGLTGLSPHSTGVMGTSPEHGSGSLLMHPLGSRMSDTWNAGGEASSLPTVGSLTAGGYLHCGSYQRQGSLLLPGLSSQLSGLNSNNATSPGAQQQLAAQPKEEAALAGRPPAPRRGNSRQLPGSIASDENDNDVESPGGMDLETALEAIINYESATTEGGVSAATAAAAQHALQQHVAAAVRAASAGMPSSQQLAGPTASSQPASASSTQQGATGAAGTTAAGGDAAGASMGLGTSFAVARMASSDLTGAPSGFGVGSAPSATAYLHQHSLASQQQYGGTGGLLSRMGSSLGHQDSNAAVVDALGVLPGGAGGLGMGTVSLSAPRTGSGWTNIVAHETQRLDLNMSASNDLFATSAPSGSMHSPALVAAAARTMAAAVQQQQQRQQQLGLGVQPTLQRSMTATTAAALMAAAKQGNTGLPLLAHAAPGTGLGMRGQLYHRLSPQMRADMQQLLMQFPGLKVEDLDEGVLQQLATRRNEQDALAALRALTGSELTTMHPLAAFTAHGADAGLSGFTTTPLNRTSSVPLASRALLQKLPPRVYARLEEVVSRCSYMDWKHFDAGVVKVMGQLSEISEADVLEELQLLEATDLSNVEYMPAYLNKRLNNRLWSRRKAQQAAQVGLGQH